MSTARLEAPAKLTTRLAVTGVRADGYHLIDATMVALDLADRLEITPADRTEVEVVAAASGFPVPAGDDNLVVRALAAAGRTARVVLHKEIPAGGGLGGGSADAAAVLRWAGCTDLDLAASIGADVAFCLVGGRARVTGIGERVEPLPTVDAAYTLMTPPFGVSTAAVYAAWDDVGGSGDGANDLEDAALAVEPRLGAYRDELARLTGMRPTLAGSGGTWFVEGDHGGRVHLDGGRLRVVRTRRPTP